MAILSLPVPVMAQDADVPTQIVDVMNKLFGVHPGFRANHAKGIVVEGSFVATPEAAELSKAAIFGGAKIPVTVRFSRTRPALDRISRTASRTRPARNFLINIICGRTAETNVTNSLHFFPVATGEDFLGLLTAITQSPKDAPHPTALETFISTHPTVPLAMATLHTPDSFAHEEYYGINAFVFVNKNGAKQAVRYQIVPDKVVYLDPKDAAAKAPDFLMDELPARLKDGPVTFHLKAQLAEPGDQTKDGSKPWPDDRKVVDLGVLTIDKAVPDSLDAQKALLFLPTSLTDGIEESDDPLIDTRAAAYAVSFTSAAI